MALIFSQKHESYFYKINDLKQPGQRGNLIYVPKISDSGNLVISRCFNTGGQG